MPTVTRFYGDTPERLAVSLRALADLIEKSAEPRISVQDAARKLRQQIIDTAGQYKAPALKRCAKRAAEMLAKMVRSGGAKGEAKQLRQQAARIDTAAAKTQAAATAKQQALLIEMADDEQGYQEWRAKLPKVEDFGHITDSKGIARLITCFKSYARQLDAPAKSKKSEPTEWRKQWTGEQLKRTGIILLAACKRLDVNAGAIQDWVSGKTRYASYGAGVAACLPVLNELDTAAQVNDVTAAEENAKNFQKMINDSLHRQRQRLRERMAARRTTVVASPAPQPPPAPVNADADNSTAANGLPEGYWLIPALSLNKIGELLECSPYSAKKMLEHCDLRNFPADNRQKWTFQIGKLAYQLRCMFEKNRKR